MKKTNEKGATLMEIIGVLGILGMVAMGLLSGIDNVHTKIRLAKGYEETKNIVKAMRQTFSAFRPANTKAKTLWELGIFNNCIPDSGEKCTGGENEYANNALGLKMEIVMPTPEQSKFAANDPTFKLIYYGVDPKTCVDLLTSDWGNDPSSGLAEISIEDGTPFQWPKDCTSGCHDLPPEMENVQTECTRAKTVNISWEYYF